MWSTAMFRTPGETNPPQGKNDPIKSEVIHSRAVLFEYHFGEQCCFIREENNVHKGGSFSKEEQRLL